MPSRCASALAAACLLLLGAPRPSSAQLPNIRLTGYLENDSAYRLRSPHVFQKSQSRLALDAEVELASSLRLRAIGWTLWDPVGRLVGPRPDFDQEPIERAQVGGSRHLEAELRELYLDWTTRLGDARLDLRLGKQQVVWGQSIGLRILDVVNAQDYREFILDDFIDARTPVFGADLEASIGAWTLQAFAFPDFEPNVLPDSASEFALDPRLPGFLPQFASFTTPPAVPEPYAIVELRSERTPKDWRLRTTAFGFRVARSWRGVDLSLHYLDAFDPAQAWRRRIEQIALPGLGMIPANRLQADHVRVRTVGASFSTSRGSFTLWGEGALAFGRALVVSDLSDRDGILRRPELQTALGLDWTGWDALFASAQWIQGVIVDHEPAIETDRLRSFLSLLLRFQLRSQTLFPQLFVLYGADDREAMIRPSLEWRATDRLTLSTGVDLFTGPRDGLLGQYAHRRRCTPVPAALPVAEAGECLPDFPPGRPSRVFLRLRYSFDFAG